MNVIQTPNKNLNRKTIEEHKISEKSDCVLILNNVRSMNNVGSIFRTSDAFALKTLYLCGITPTPPHREIQKTALGATDSVDWKYEQNIMLLLKKLKAENYKIIAIEQTNTSKMLDEAKMLESNACAFILGNELEGVEQEVLNFADDCIEIPQNGTKHSLNISVCAGILLWEMARQKKAFDILKKT